MFDRKVEWKARKKSQKSVQRGLCTDFHSICSKSAAVEVPVGAEAVMMAVIDWCSGDENDQSNAHTWYVLHSSDTVC